MALQLRKRGISKVVLAGMSANLCVESHLRELLEQGFEVTVVEDATAAAQHPELGDGYAAALTNSAFIANGAVTTEEAVEGLRAGDAVGPSVLRDPGQRYGGEPGTDPRAAARRARTGAATHERSR